MHKHPPKEGHVILVNLEKHQELVDRYKTYFEAKLRLTGLASAELQRRQQIVERNLKQRPDDILGYVSLAAHFERQGNFSGATKALEDGLKINRWCPDLYMLLGLLYEYQQQPQKALDAYKKGRKAIKVRPAICLRQLPSGYNEFLVCGLSRLSGRKQYYVKNFDEIVTPADDQLSKLDGKSVIRLGFLGRVKIKDIEGHIGSISVVRHRRLLKKLSNHMQGNLVV